MKVILEMVGLPSQRVEAKLIRVSGSVAVVESYSSERESYYRLSDGRSVESDGTPTNWNFWALSKCDRIRLRAKAQ
jgi:hypothetical protein